ncbi:hypothetical protein ACFYYR_27330 [Streptomyces sp. NPDC001922]|uniref:hypothetical protein n=1 Tax=Streptomyces sp. NPDC001922 TaxID=3364624 RepID=UPI0036AE3032
MSTGQTAKARRGTAAVALAAALVLVVSGCGGEEAGKPQEPKRTERAKGDGGAERQDNEAAEPRRVLATIKGRSGLIITVTEADRDSGGFVTVSGTLKNTSDEDFISTDATDWSGDEEEVLKHGESLGGATLVDSTGKKRYYVLRDTEGRPLCTTFESDIEAGKSVPVFAQFPAPPANTRKVDFQVPTFPSASIEISG